MSTRTRPLGRMTVSIPEELLDRALPKATGKVRLPDHIAWSPPYQYDLADRRSLRRAYQRVMTEGLARDVLWFVDLDILIEEWDALHLSSHVREPWERWLRARGLLD